MAFAAIDEAWSQAFADNIAQDSEALRKQGWKTLSDLSNQTGRVVHTLSAIMKSNVTSGKFECKKVKVIHAGRVILMNFYRPIVEQ